MAIPTHPKDPAHLTKRPARVLSIEAIEPAPWNPPRRSEKANLKDLHDWMDAEGQLVEVLLDEKNMLVDGHRRYAVAKKLGFIAMKVSFTLSKYVALYGVVNKTQRKFSGNDLLYVYMKKPEVLLKSQLDAIAKCELDCGAEVVEELYERNLTVSVYNTAKKLRDYCNTKDLTTYAIMRWMLDVDMVSIASQLLATDISPKRLIAAINNEKTLLVSRSVSYHVAAA